jgi:hypothetical protein
MCVSLARWPEAEAEGGLAAKVVLQPPDVGVVHPNRRDDPLDDLGWEPDARAVLVPVGGHLV